MNQIKVLFFATLRDRAGEKSVNIEIPEETSVLALKDIIVKTFPGLQKSISYVVVSVNREFAFDENIIPENAEVAMFPPVSGGKD